MPEIAYSQSEVAELILRAAAEGSRAAMEQTAPILARTERLLREAGAHRVTMTVRQAADYMEVEPGTVRDWIAQGLPANNRGGSMGYLIHKAELDDWLTGRAAREVSLAPPPAP